MAVNAKTEMFDHIELFGKPALFTNFRIDRSTVPENWYCYDFRGSDNDPGKLNYVELRVGVNHSGAVLLPEELDLKGKDYRRVRGQINFLGSRMTLETFCKVHQLPYPAEEEKYHIRPARPDEAGLFYTPHPSEDERLGTIGHVRMDFGRSGNAAFRMEEKRRIPSMGGFSLDEQVVFCYTKIKGMPKTTERVGCKEVR